MEWSELDVFKLINLYSQFPCLWDFQSPVYKRVDKKKNAWQEISKNMAKSEDNVKKKMKNLRSAYLVEKKKVDSSKKSGSAADDVYIPHLYYYSEMNFIDRSICLRQTSSSLSPEESEIVEFSPTTESPMNSNFSEIYDSPKSSVSETPIVTPVSSQKATSSYGSKKRKAERDEKINIALDSIIRKTNEDCGGETMFSCFGKSVGLQLEKMPLNKAMEVMADIQKLLTAAITKRDILEASMLAANI